MKFNFCAQKWKNIKLQYYVNYTMIKNVLLMYKIMSQFRYFGLIVTFLTVSEI